MKSYFVSILLIVIVLFYQHVHIQSFNLDTKVPVYKTFGGTNNNLSPNFGFSVSVHKQNFPSTYWVLIGAPFAYKDNEVHGAVYKCPITVSDSDCVSLPVAPPVFEQSKYQTANQLLGFTVESGTIFNAAPGGAFVCAPRYTEINTNLVVGTCYEIKNNLISDPLDTGAFAGISMAKNCLYQLNKNNIKREYVICEFGTAISVSRKFAGYFIGGAAFVGGKGIGINTYTDPTNFMLQRNEAIRPNVQEHINAGYSLSRGSILHGFEESVVVGAPAVPTTNVTLPNSGNGMMFLMSFVPETKKFAYSEIYYGSQFGIRFGQAVLAVDLNGDGWDEVLVGAPFYPTKPTTADKNLATGAVYLFRNEKASGKDRRLVQDPNPIRVPRQKKGFDSPQFGNSIAYIGDINRDGYKDFAVGAPFHDNNGCVYIYMGSKELILRDYVQRICADDITTGVGGFGFALSGGLDVDGNGYSDVVVGSVTSNQVFVLRARPVVTFFGGNLISPSTQLPGSLGTCASGAGQSCLTIPVSMYYTRPDGCPVSAKDYLVPQVLRLDADRKKLPWERYASRLVFDTNPIVNMASGEIYSKCTNDRKVLSGATPLMKVVKLRDDPFMDKFNPIKLAFSWNVTLNGPPSRFSAPTPNLVNLNDYPISNPFEKNETQLLRFQQACGSTPCSPELSWSSKSSLKKMDGEYVIFIGQEDVIWTNFTVKNMATDPARSESHQTILKLDVSSQYMQVMSAVPGPWKSFDEMAGVVCLLGNPLLFGKTAECNFKLKIRSLAEANERFLYINATLFTLQNPRLKTENIRIRIKMMTNVQVIGSIKPSQVAYESKHVIGASAITKENKIGPDLNITFEVSNHLEGSVIPSSRLVIEWPYEVTGDPAEPNGKYLLYLMHPPRVTVGSKQNVTCDGEVLSELVNVLNVRPLGAQDPEKQGGSAVVAQPVLTPPGFTRPLTKATSTQEASYAKDKTVVLDCAKGTARCKPLTCRLGPVSRKAGLIMISFQARLWQFTLVEDYRKASFVETVVRATWKPDAVFDIVPQGADKTVGTVDAIKFLSSEVTLVAANGLEREDEKPTNLVLIICLSVAGGLIVLVLIVVILWKLKFFQRNRLRRTRGDPAASAPLTRYEYNE